MSFTDKDYRQFAHDSLNILGRLQSVAELAEMDDETLKKLFMQDVATLSRAIKMFSQIGWSETHEEMGETSRVDASALLYEIVNADRPEGSLLSIDENIPVQTNQGLLRAVLAELVHNVAAHGDPEKPSKITLGKTSKGYVLELKNAVKYPVPAQPEKLFEKGHDSHGLGLGLTMVTSAAKALDMPFSYESMDEMFVAKLTVAKV